MMKIKQIHNFSFLINPTMNLFPLSGQSGNYGVSIMITLKKQKLEYKINNKINYTTLQIRSILVWKEMSRKRWKGHRRKSPQGGMEKGLKRGYSKNSFIYYWLQYQWTKISKNSWSLYRLKPRSYSYTKNLQILWQKRDP